MRKSSIAVLFGICLFAAPAFAGEVTIANGEAGWKSTQCPAPVVPAVLSGVDSESSANDVNSRITQYNTYLKQVQVYMDCMSSEAQRDATAASTAIVNSAQAQIIEVHQRAEALGTPLKK